MKWFKECPLIISLAAVSLILTIISFALKDDVYESYTEGQKDFSHPVLSLVFRGLSDGVFPWSSDVQVIPGVGMEVASLDEDTEREEEKESPEEEPAEAEDGAEDLTAEEENSEGEASEEEQDEELSEEDAKFPEILEFSEVDDDYFCDALFIGDSRTVGLSEYCEELDTRATFYSKISLTIFDCMTKEFIKTDEGKINIETALSKEQYSKIYIMLGLNEIGTGNEGYFAQAYVDVLHQIEDLQPDAIIYIQGIMHVTEAKSSNDKNFNNDRINLRNKVLSELADNRRVFYIDMNGEVDDGRGNLDRDLSFDDVHLKASAYERWHQFLLHNAIVR